MKTFRILIVLVLAFATIGASPAQSGAQRVGFIRLLSSINPNAPVQSQARRALARLMPQLRILQERGILLGFEPEFRAGILKVTYAEGGPSISAFGEIEIYDNARDAVPDAVRQQSFSGGPGTEDITPSFTFQLYSGCFSATDLGEFSHVVGSLRDKSNRVLASYESDADIDGEIFFDCFPGTGPFAEVVPGYKLTFEVYDTTPVLLGTFTVTAPNISFTSFTNSKAVVRGKGPAGKPFAVDWYQRDWNDVDTWSQSSRMGTISPSGVWAKDMGTQPIRGGDTVDVFVIQNPNFTFVHTMDVPYIYCVLGGNYCEISGFAFRPATFSIVQGSVTRTFSGKFDEEGYFSVELRKGGSPIFIKSGNRVSGTNVPPYKLPVITGNVDFLTDMVNGKAPKNRYFELWAYTLCPCSTYFVYANSTGVGTYSGDFSSQVDLVETEATNIEVYFQDPATGNITDYYRSYGP